jgi:hypothetical protein
MFRKHTKQFYRYLGAKTIDIKDHPRMEEAELYWKSYVKKVGHSEKLQWLIREEKN